MNENLNDKINYPDLSDKTEELKDVIIVDPELNDQKSDINKDSNSQQSNISQHSVQLEETKTKKNRTLQFFKFLLYSLKIEIKTNEFLILIKYSSQVEIILWILSIILFFAGGSKYTFVWLHIFHFIRGIIGIYVLRKMPMTHDLIEKLNVDDRTFETKLYNDIVRDVFKTEALPKLNAIRGWLVFYFCISLVNLFIDVIDFLYCLSKLGSNPKEITSEYNNQFSYFSYFAIALIYLSTY